MDNTLATIKEAFTMESTPSLTQLLAPRYMTRSRAQIDSKESVRVIEGKQGSYKPTTPSHPNRLDKENLGISKVVPESLSRSITVDTESSHSTVKVSTPTEKRRLAEVSPSASTLKQSGGERKRGRHKEYTAPTGVWKTNGGYISTIYVDNKRVYGPLRDNAEDAGIDRQKLIEAKSFVNNEFEMRSFISVLKSSPNPQNVDTGSIANNIVTTTQQPINNSTTYQQLGQLVQQSKPRYTTSRPKPKLSTITSIPTLIVSFEKDPNHAADQHSHQNTSELLNEEQTINPVDNQYNSSQYTNGSDAINCSLKFEDNGEIEYSLS